MTPRARQEEGFALAETLVAAAIIAAMMGLTYQTVSANAQAARLIAERREAVLVAQSVLAQATGPTSDGGQAAGGGRAGSLSWRVATNPYSTGARAGGLPLEQVTVNVFGKRPHAPVMTLATLRLVR